MKIEIAVTPISRTIMILMGFVVLVLAALAAQVVWKAGPMASLEAAPATSTIGESVSHLPLFTQAREASAPASAYDRSLTFAQAREQWYGVEVARLPAFTQAREASGYATLVANQDVPLFTQAREGSGYYAPPVAYRGLPLFTQAREQESGVNTTGFSLFTQAREG